MLVTLKRSRTGASPGVLPPTSCAHSSQGRVSDVCEQGRAWLGEPPKLRGQGSPGHIPQPSVPASVEAFHPRVPPHCPLSRQLCLQVLPPLPPALTTLQVKGQRHPRPSHVAGLRSRDRTGLTRPQAGAGTREALVELHGALKAHTRLDRTWGASLQLWSPPLCSNPTETSGDKACPAQLHTPAPHPNPFALLGCGPICISSSPGEEGMASLDCSLPKPLPLP